MSDTSRLIYANECLDKEREKRATILTAYRRYLYANDDDEESNEPGTLFVEIMWHFRELDELNDETDEAASDTGIYTDELVLQVRKEREEHKATFASIQEQFENENKEKEND